MYSIRAVLLALAILASAPLVGGSQNFAKLGDKAFKNQNYQQALAFYEQALQEHPNDPRVQLALGKVYYHLQEYDQAEKLLRAVHSQNPKDGTATLYLGMIAENKKDYGDAAEMYRKYLATAGKSKLTPQIQGRLLFVQNELMRAQVAEAIKNEKALASETLPRPYRRCTAVHYSQQSK